MSQIDTNAFLLLLLFLLIGIMMVVKMTARTTIIIYVLVKFYYLTYGEHTVQSRGIFTSPPTPAERGLQEKGLKF